MKRKLKKKSIVILTLSFALIVGLFALILNVSNSFRSSDSKVDNKEYMMNIDGGSYGNWETSISFDDSIDFYTVDGNYLEYNIEDGGENTDQIPLIISLRLEENSIQDTIPKNGIKISFPLYIFNADIVGNLSWTTYPDGADINDEADIISQIYTDSGIPFCEGTCEEDPGTDFYFTVDEDTGDFYITNYSEINSDSSYDLEYYINYVQNLSSIKYNEEYTIQSYFDIVGERYNYDELTTKITNSGGGQGDEISLDNLNGIVSERYNEWQTDEWGEYTGDADFYLAYTISGAIDYNDIFTLNIRPDNSNGALIAYSNDGENYEIGNIIQYNNSPNSCSYHSNPNVNCTLVYGFYFEDQPSIDTYTQINAVANYNGNTSNRLFEFNGSYENSQEPVIPTYPSGTSINTSLTTINDDDGIGGINQIEKSENVDVSFRLSSGLDSVSSSNGQNINAFNLWELTNEGDTNYTVTMSTDGMYLDDKFDSIGNIENLNNDDYEISSFSLIDDIEYNYDLVNNKYRLVESSNDTAAKNVYAKINGEYQKIGTYYRSGNNYYFDSSYTGVESVSSSDYKFKVNLPSNVSDIKIEYTGNTAAVYMGIVVDAKLKPSNNVKNILEDKSSIILKEKYATSVNDLNDSGYKGTYLTKLDTFSGSSGSALKNSKVGGSDSITFTDNFYEGISFNNNGSKSKALSLLNKQDSATVYELLPKGATLDGDVRCKTYKNNSNCNVTIVDTIDNYIDNRTMVKLNVSYDNNYYESSNKYESGFTIELDVLYSSDSNAQYGQVLYKDVAYVSNGLLSEGYSSALDADISLFSSESIRNKFNSIDGDYKLFATSMIEVDASSVDSGTAAMNVKNTYNNNYGQNTSVVVGQQYKYKLEYNFASEYEEMTNVKFVDILENNYGNKEHFNGYLESIDVSALRDMGVTPTIYYASNIDLVDINNINVNDTNVWSTLKPNNVVAIVVDCGNYEIKGIEQKSPYIEIEMSSINEFSNKKAYNKGYVLYNQVGSSINKKIESNGTEVSLIKDTISYNVTGTGGAGTSSNPVILDDNFEYNISLSNTSDTYEYNNLEFVFKVPEGLNVGDISGIDASNYTINGNKIIFNISKLNGSQSINITIPVSIVVGNESLYTYNSESSITKLNNRDYSGEVIKTYHQVKLPTLVFDKKIKTINSGEFINGTALVANGEKYNYQINVKNTSVAKAKNIEVIDNVPNNVIVDESSITNGGLYDDSNRTIKWNIDLLANSTINLKYDVTLGDVSLGTRLSSSGTIKLKNPFDNNAYLYDEATNVVTAYYQVASDLKVTNKLDGALADSNKLFTYTFEFNGTEDNAGTYEVFNKSNSKIGTFDIDNSGKGNYSVKLKGSESATIKMLTSGINYSVKLKVEEGYEVSSNVGGLVSDNYVITGTTDETNDSYELTNSYDVSTTQTISAKVTYDKDISAGMFKLSMGSEEKSNDASGNVTFDQITYDNVVGQYKYTIKQINTGVKKVKYDTSQYTATVNVVNDGKGHLTSSVKYYDSSNKEVTSAIFNNKYVPSGFMVVSDNTSDYIDKDKKFNYTLDFNSSDGLNGSYVVKDNNSKELDELVFENGIAHYEFSLGSDDTILFVDLPNGINYTILQELVPYYTTVVRKINIEDANSFVLGTDLNDKEENGTVGDTGVTSDDTTVITFDNNYKTSAKYQVKSKVSLVDKKLEDGEFTFKITDISSGSTKGYTETVKNNKDGEIAFNTINYKVPGTYKYEIRQVKGTSNHIYYDSSKIELTLVLTDNGDGTMRVLDTYEFFGDDDHFINKYSKDPIIPENKNESINPNTLDRSLLIGCLFFIVILLMIIEGRIKTRSYRLRS